MITPNGTLIEVYENRNRTTTIKVENSRQSSQDGWIWLQHSDIDFLIAELQKHQARLKSRNNS